MDQQFQMDFKKIDEPVQLYGYYIGPHEFRYDQSSQDGWQLTESFDENAEQLPNEFGNQKRQPKDE